MAKETMVKVTRAGDSKFRTEQIVSLSEFLNQVRAVLELGGEMPIAQWESGGPFSPKREQEERGLVMGGDIPTSRILPGRRIASRLVLRMAQARVIRGRLNEDEILQLAQEESVPLTREQARRLAMAQPSRETGLVMGEEGMPPKILPRLFGAPWERKE